MSERAYTNDSQSRGYQVILALAGNEFTGLLPSEIAKKVDASPSAITRDLRVLQDSGLAEQIQETGRWRLGPRLVQIAVAFQMHLDTARRRLDEINQRYTRTPN